MSLFLHIVLIVVVVEAVVEICVKSLLFDSLRKNVHRVPYLGGFLDKVFSCGHCFSVWASLFMVPVYFVFIVDYKVCFPKSLFLWFFVSILIHRLSNYLHMFIDRYVDKFYLPPKKNS